MSLHEPRSKFPRIQGPPTLLARGEESAVVAPPVPHADEVQATPATVLVEERTEEAAERVPPDLATGHDGELALEVAGSLVRADEAELHRPLGHETELVQLPQELGILVIIDLAVETDEDELTLAIATFGREVLVVDIPLEIAVELHRVPGLHEGLPVVPGEGDGRDGGLGVSGLPLVPPQEGSEVTALQENLELIPFDLRLGDEI